MQAEGPLISIIIPTLNSEGTIGLCLNSISAQTYKNIEVIVIDKRSNDRTVSIAQGAGAITLVVDASERCEQLNIGINSSKGKYVYRVDSDFILEPDVVYECVQKCELEGYDGIYVHNTSDETVSFWAKVRKLERDCYADDESNVAARFVRKDALLDIGWFDTRLVACEDYDLHNRLLIRGYKLTGIRAKEVHLGEPRTLAEIIRKHYYYGRTLNAFIEKEESGGTKQLSPLRPSFIKHWKDFIKHPVLTAGFFVYQIARYSSSIAGYMSVKFFSGS